MPDNLRRQVQKLWDKGTVLSSLISNDNVFPVRLALKRPSSSELPRCFDEVRQWVSSLMKLESRGYRIVWQEVNHRVIGKNILPKEVWVDSIADVQGIIGKRNEIECFKAIVSITAQSYPSMFPWLRRYPLKALGLCDEWESLLQVVAWLQAHPRPGVYLRQVDIPGIHSKLIERHRKVLSELLDIVLPGAAINYDATGLSKFCRRYGFKERPTRIRFRILDPKLAIFPSNTEQDIAITHDTFAQLAISVQKVYITENEINFLSFPQQKNGMVIFGAGYGFDMLGMADWLHNTSLHYWGDIDTHGFAILDQLRSFFPHVESFLMDRKVLLAHKRLWVHEPQPEQRDLLRLTDDEREVYDDLRHNRFGKAIRLEQEHIGFSYLMSALFADDVPRCN